MCTLILLCGIVTVSWYAELALRTRVSMSAIGSVIVMRRPSEGASQGRLRPEERAERVAGPTESLGSCLSRRGSPADPGPAAKGATSFDGLVTESPAGLGHARQLAGVRHFSYTDPAEAERAIDGAGPAAALAAGVRADRELRLAGRLRDKCLLGHFLPQLLAAPAAR